MIHLSTISLLPQVLRCVYVCVCPVLLRGVWVAGTCTAAEFWCMQWSPLLVFYIIWSFWVCLCIFCNICLYTGQAVCGQARSRLRARDLARFLLVKFDEKTVNLQPNTQVGFCLTNDVCLEETVFSCHSLSPVGISTLNHYVPYFTGEEAASFCTKLANGQAFTLYSSTLQCSMR